MFRHASGSNFNDLNGFGISRSVSPFKKGRMAGGKVSKFILVNGISIDCRKILKHVDARTNLAKLCHRFQHFRLLRHAFAPLLKAKSALFLCG